MTRPHADEKHHGRSKKIVPPKPFPFFALPSELRIRVYELALHVPYTIDLDPANYHRIIPKLRLLFTCRRMYEEGYRVFYGINTFRLFPVYPGRFFHSKRPLICRFPQNYRAEISTIELRLGPGFTAPPRGWVVNSKLGLGDLRSLRTLKVFMEIDPASNEIFEGFRKSKEFYTEFCVHLLREIFAQVDYLQDVEFDAYPSVPRNSPLMRALLQETRSARKRILWGPERGWSDNSSITDLQRLGQSMSLLSLSRP